MKRAAAVAGLLLAGLAAIALVRAALLPSRQPRVEPAPVVPVDAQAVAEHLAAAVRFPTISTQDPSQLDRSAFEGLQRWLERTYPALGTLLTRERVAGLSLLYTWRGSDPSQPALLLLAHQDVVPVDPGSSGEWSHPPFAGAIADGQVWGRGSLDDKASLVCVLEAVQRLAAEGFQPRRTVLLAFGHDEEVGGDAGAARIAALLAERHVPVELVLDEGGVIAQGFVPGLASPVAVIGIAEKGSVSIALGVDAPGGHSSTPPRHSAIGDLATAVTRLEAWPMPAGIDGTTALFLDHLAPELPFAARVVLANRWLFGPLLQLGFARIPALDAMLRTTTAVTLIQGGVKENVLPIHAQAIANFRIHPRDSVATVAEHVRRAVGDERIHLQVGLREEPREPSPVSPVDSDAFRLLQRTVAQIFPGVPAVPYLVLGGTDARHYAVLTPNVYRFGPYVMGKEALHLAHGTNERISLENLAAGVRFYLQLLRNAAAPPQGSSA